MGGALRQQHNYIVTLYDYWGFQSSEVQRIVWKALWALCRNIF